MKMSIAVVFSALSFGERKLTKYARVAATAWFGTLRADQIGAHSRKNRTCHGWGRGRSVRGRRNDAHGQ